MSICQSPCTAARRKNARSSACKRRRAHSPASLLLLFALDAGMKGTSPSCPEGSLTRHPKRGRVRQRPAAAPRNAICPGSTGPWSSCELRPSVCLTTLMSRLLLPLSHPGILFGGRVGPARNTKTPFRNIRVRSRKELLTGASERPAHAAGSPFSVQCAQYHFLTGRAGSEACAVHDRASGRSASSVARGEGQAGGSAAEEMAFLDHYLAIQRIRFGDHLKIEVLSHPM